MTLDRGVLARIDRAILAALGHEREIRLVKLPLSEATWSIWRRYCDAIGIPMGHAIAALVEHELRLSSKISTKVRSSSANSSEAWPNGNRPSTLGSAVSPPGSSGSRRSYSPCESVPA